jgi:integrase
MKGREEHRIPLSRQAIALLKALPREADNPYVFIGAIAGKPPGREALYVVTKALRPGVTTHGFRSSFKDWATERTAFPAIVAEMALAHKVGSAVERAYRRTDLFEWRGKLMQLWADSIDKPQQLTRQVTPLRRRA